MGPDPFVAERRRRFRCVQKMVFVRVIWVHVLPRRGRVGFPPRDRRPGAGEDGGGHGGSRDTRRIVGAFGTPHDNGVFPPGNDVTPFDDDVAQFHNDIIPSPNRTAVLDNLA